LLLFVGIVLVGCFGSVEAKTEAQRSIIALVGLVAAFVCFGLPFRIIMSLIASEEYSETLDGKRLIVRTAMCSHCREKLSWRVIPYFADVEFKCPFCRGTLRSTGGSIF